VTSFTQVFGGGTLDPAQPSYKLYSATAPVSITSVWPTEASTSQDVVAAINDISFGTTTGLTFTLPPANQVSVGYNALFNNVGTSAFTVLANGGGTVLTATSGAAWSAYVTDNTTASGAYRVYQAGAGTSSAVAGTLAGLGIKAITTTLNQEYPAFTVSATALITASYRAATIVYTGGAGVFTFDPLATLTSGWFVNIVNRGPPVGGGGALVITPPSGLIDGQLTKTMNPGDSCIVTTNGSAMFTVGFGQSAVYAFSFITINLGVGFSGDYTLSGSELNKTAIQFTGTLVGAVNIIVPFTAQQYWVDNSTTGSTGFAFLVKTSTQTGGADVENDGTNPRREILYCNATIVVSADTTGLSTPLGIGDGGTGASTASGALVNLGGGTVGIPVFQSNTTASALSLLNAPSTLDAFTYVQMFS
jgi:hypothetical protein